MTKVSVDEKGQLWWIGALLWGYVALLTLISLSGAVDLFSFSLFLGALVFGAILGIPAWQKWRAGGFAKRPPEPMGVEFVDTEKERGEYTFRLVGKQRSKIGPPLKEPKVGYGTFVLWWVFVRAPVVVGDWLLSSFFRAVTRVAPESLLGVRGLPGFGGGESSILEQAQEVGLLHEDEDPTRPNPTENTF